MNWITFYIFCQFCIFRINTLQFEHLHLNADLVPNDISCELLHSIAGPVAPVRRRCRCRSSHRQIAGVPSAHSREPDWATCRNSLEHNRHIRCSRTSTGTRCTCSCTATATELSEHRAYDCWCYSCYCCFCCSLDHWHRAEPFSAHSIETIRSTVL